MRSLNRYPGSTRQLSARPSRFAEAALKRPKDGEIGVAGDLFESGLPVDPYNPDLDGAAWFAKVEEMRRAGGQVQAVEYVVSLPIIATEWTVEGASDELNEMVRGNLLDDNHEWSMSTTWSDVIRRACLSALYGTWAFEKVWKDVDGKALIRRLPDRLPRTIAEYRFDQDNSLSGILQKASDREGNEVETEIPIDRLLLFPYRKEGDNWNGLSVLRGAHLHWYIIQALYRIANIGIERSLNGTPIGKLPANYKDADKSAFLALLSAYRRAEGGAIVLPPGYELQDGSLLGGKDSVEFQAYIEHHAAWIARAALADFVILGESARALGDVKIDFFLMAWEAFAGELEATFNRHLVRQMIAFNAPSASGDDIPRITHAPIGQLMRLKEASDFLGALMSGKFIIPDQSRLDENVFRKLLGLPEVEEAQPAEVGAGDVAEEASQAGLSAAVTASERPAPQRRRFAERDVAATVAAVRADKAVALDEWQARGEQYLADILSDLLTEVDQAQADPALLAEVRVAPATVRQYAAWIAEWLDQVYETGAQRMEEEIGIAAPVIAGAADRFAARGRLIAEHHAEAARFAVVSAALDGESLDAIAARYSDQLDVRLRGDLTDEARAIADQLNAAPGS